jgi:hypothetical protein
MDSGKSYFFNAYAQQNQFERPAADPQEIYARL